MDSHLEPQNCFICGHGPHAEGSHKFWSNQDAEQEFAKQPEPAYSVEAAYVSQHRPY